jgi:hypothetical protein
MKYFIDTEFHEYERKPYWSKPVNTIELISIGIISEDGREYYAISKNFNIKAAWNNEWLRENVLKGIWKELYEKERYVREYHWNLIEFSYKGLKNLIQWNSKSNKQIAEEIFEFVNPKVKSNTEEWTKHLNKFKILATENQNVQFYGYYSDYDWVVFCRLFGRMIDLPKGFPIYCIDLKQILDEKASKGYRFGENSSLEECLNYYKQKDTYPKQTNEHNALADATWNYELYKFLQTI